VKTLVERLEVHRKDINEKIVRFDEREGQLKALLEKLAEISQVEKDSIERFIRIENEQKELAQRISVSESHHKELSSQQKEILELLKDLREKHLPAIAPPPQSSPSGRRCPSPQFLHRKLTVKRARAKDAAGEESNPKKFRSGMKGRPREYDKLKGDEISIEDVLKQMDDTNLFKGPRLQKLKEFIHRSWKNTPHIRQRKAGPRDDMSNPIYYPPNAFAKLREMIDNYKADAFMAIPDDNADEDMATDDEESSAVGRNLTAITIIDTGASRLQPAPTAPAPALQSQSLMALSGNSRLLQQQ